MFDKKGTGFLWRNGDGNGKDEGTDPRTTRAGNAGAAENHPAIPAAHHKISAGTGNRSGGEARGYNARMGRTLRRLPRLLI